MPKRYLNYEEVTNVWGNIQVHWEDLYVVTGGAATSRWIRDNPWEKPWNRPEWQQMTEDERRRVLERHGIVEKKSDNLWGDL
jgi:chlorite dismutase